MGPVSSKNPDWKRVFWEGRNFAPGHFCPQSRHLVRLAHKIGEVRFSTKIQAENVFFGKTNSRGLLRQNWARFSFGTILPLNAPYCQLGPKKRYGASFIKKSHWKLVFWEGRNFASGHFYPQSRHLLHLAQKIGEVRFCSKIQTENVFFGETNMRGLFRQNWAKFSSATILHPNAPCSQLGPEKRYGAGFVKKFHPQTCFLGCTKLRFGRLLPPIAPSNPFGP